MVHLTMTNKNRVACKCDAGMDRTWVLYAAPCPYNSSLMWI